MSWNDLQPFHRLLLQAGGLALLGIFLLLLPSGRRFRNGYQVVERGSGLYIIRLAGLLALGWGVYLGVAKVWLPSRSPVSLDISAWTQRATADGVCSVLLPPVDDDAEQPALPGMSFGWASPDRRTVFAVTEAAAGPGVGLTPGPAMLRAAGQTAAFAMDGIDFPSATVSHQQNITTGGVNGLRIGIELPPSHRFFSQQYLAAGKAYTVMMFAPRERFADGTAKGFFDSVAIRPAGPVAPAPRLGSDRPGPRPAPPGGSPTRRFETKPGVKRVGE